MQLTKLLEQSRYYLDDDSYERITDDELIVYINTAYAYYYNDMINKNYRRLLKNANISVSIDGIAALPVDFYKADIVYYVKDDYSYPVNFYINYEEIERSGEGSGYTFEGNYLKFYGLTSCTIKLTYFPTKTDLDLLTDSPVTAILEDWQKMIPLKAALLVKGGREEEDTIEISRLLIMLETTYNDYLTKMTNSRSYVHPFIF